MKAKPKGLSSRWFVRSRWIAVVLILGQPMAATTDLRAGLCMPSDSKPSDAYSYLIALTDALGMAKSAQERIPEAPEGSGDPIAVAGDTMRGLKLARADYECAARILSGYKSSPNEAIKTSATGGILAFTLLATHMDRMVAALAKLIDAEGQGLGSHLAERAQIAADTDEALKMLIPATAAATYSILAKDPGSDRYTRFTLTAAERSEIQRRLRGAFGPSVQDGMKVGQLPLFAAAAALCGFLGDTRWQSAPNR